MDTEKRLWFRNKRYGYGWTPATWEGWMTILLYVMLLVPLVRNIILLADTHPQFDDVVLLAFGKIFLLTGMLLLICYLKGEKPKWQWNKD